MNWKMFASGAMLTVVLAGCGDNATPPAPAPTPAPATTTAAAVDMKAAAENLIADAAKYVTEAKWDLAEKAVTELEGMKAKLPAEYGPRIDRLKATLATAKTAAATMPTSMPAMPKLP